MTYQDPSNYEHSYYYANDAGAPYGATPYGAIPYRASTHGASTYGASTYGASTYGASAYGTTPYGPTYYGAAPQMPAYRSPYGPQETPPIEIESDRPWKVRFIACALLIFGSLLFILSVGTQIIATADEDADGAGRDNKILTLATYKTPGFPGNRGPRGRSTSSTIITTQTGSPRTAAITTPVVTLPPVIYRPPEKYSMICTVGCHGKYAVEFPPDGVCDFIFLDSLYDGCPDQFVQHRSPSNSWRRFQALAASGIETQFGISIDALGIPKFLGHLRNRQNAEVWASQSLWNNNIYHWGVMNIHQILLQSRPAFLKQALEALKEAAEFSLPSPTKRVASYTFLGFYSPLPSGCDLMGQEATSLFMPDAIVVLGHTSFQENKLAIPSLRCILLPPNIYKIPPGVRANTTHAHTFYEACLLAKCLRTQQNIQVPIGVSFTMKGRWYQPKVDDYENADIGEYDLFKDCSVSDVDQDAIPAAVCNQTNTNYTKNLGFDKDALTMRTYDKGAKEKHTQMFDNRATYLHKLCFATYNLTQVEFAIAIYDVNFDSSGSICQPDKIVGNFTRTELLYKLNTFLKTGATDLSKRASCSPIIK